MNCESLFFINLLASFTIFVKIGEILIKLIKNPLLREYFLRRTMKQSCIAG